MAPSSSGAGTGTTATAAPADTDTPAGSDGSEDMTSNIGAPAPDSSLNLQNGLTPVPAPGAGGVSRPAGAAGNLTVLDWAGFSAAMTYTFDDANSSQINAYETLQSAGVPLTFYLQTGKPDAKSEVWKQAVLDGHELGNHTKSHNSGDSAGIDADTDAATEFLETEYGVAVWSMAAPFGDNEYVDIARERFVFNRGVGGGTISARGTTDPFNLNTWTPPSDTAEAEFNGKVDAARTAGAWQIVLLHGFTGGTDGAYQPVPLDGFVASLEYAKSLQDVWLGSLVQVGSYWLGQRMFNAATPEQVDGGQRWTWELPELFPSGVMLRVTVDGGTLMQGETELTWDEHGYYEVSLDAKSLTLLD